MSSSWTPRIRIPQGPAIKPPFATPKSMRQGKGLAKPPGIRKAQGIRPTPMSTIKALKPTTLGSIYRKGR